MSLTAADSSGSGADQVLADVWQLASMVEAQLAEALRTLTDSDLEGADVVIQADLEVNRLRYLIEERVTAELAPGLGEDRLHLLIAVLYVISDLERIGDHAEGIAKVALMLGRPPMRSLPASWGSWSGRCSRRASGCSATATWRVPACWSGMTMPSTASTTTSTGR